MKKTDLAYTAGIIDGEGCISLSRYGKGDTYYISLSVSVGNTNEWLIQWLKFSYGGRTILKGGKNRQGKNWKPCWEWIISSNEALDFLRLLYPYLRLKKAQTEIAIRFQNARQTEKRTSPRSNQIKVLEEADRILMANLNKRGKEVKSGLVSPETQ